MKPRALKAWTAAAVVVLLGLHFTLAVGSKLHESTTTDEIAHVTGGYSYWKFNDYRLQPENGNLAQRWLALPVWAAAPKFPELVTAWRESDVWNLGNDFFYHSGNDHFPLLMAARAMSALLSVALGALVFFWSRSLFGTAGGLVSLVFFTFCPTLLANGGLATSDVCAAFFMLASLGAWWRHLCRPGPAGFALSGVALGLACVAKFSSVLIAPMFVICGLVHVAVHPGQFGRLIRSAAGHIVVAIAVIWAFYGFRYSAFNPALPAAERFILSWDEILAGTGWAGRAVRLLSERRILPEGFLYGAAYVLKTANTRASFLNGSYSITGWRNFFIWSFAIKSTLPFLCASALAVWVIARRQVAFPAGQARRAALLALTPLGVFFAVYWAASLASHLNIGHRHLIPTYPVLLIALGALGGWLSSPLGSKALWVGALAAWHLGESLWIFPHYLAYFNELAGGPANGYRHLVDSSLDWGQDLPGLKDWLAKNLRPNEDAYLAYFGSGDPAYYRMPVKRLYYINILSSGEHYIPLGPGLYCISATMLQHVYSSVQGPWTLELEKEYQRLRAVESTFKAYEDDPKERAQMERFMPREKWDKTRNRFLQLRFARLCTFLRIRKPDAQIGYSLFVYRLSEQEVLWATGPSIKDWIALVERTEANR